MQFSVPAVSSKNVLKIAAAVVAVLLATAGLVAAASLDTKVTLDVDGEVTTTRTSAETVDELLVSRGIEPRPEDKVSHKLSEPIPKDETITVRYAKPVTVVVDGDSSDEITYATTVKELLADAKVEPAKGAYVSQQLDDKVNRYGEEIVVSNPKTLTVTADGRDQQVETNKPTVEDVLNEAGVTVDEDDEVEPGLDAYVAHDTALRVVRIEKLSRTENVPVDFEVQVQEDGSLPKGETEVLTEGRAGEAAEEVQLVLADGEVRERTVISRSTVREPVAQVEKRGTKPEAVAPVSLDGVWGALAQCESGGNPRANNSGMYFGLYQFSVQTWQSVGGAGNPADASPEEQTQRAQILQQRSGWGQWPACARKLGLL